jgi:hypothetical protein
MLIWLKGVGRNHAELDRILNESRDEGATYFRYRRSRDRHELGDAHGELVYMKTRTPCQVLDLSEDGCAVRTEKPFRPGALAPVEIVLPILGMILHIAGVTQWVKKEHHMGVQFKHADSSSRHQMEALIACLLGQKTVESVKESIASRKLNLSTGDVLAVRPPDAEPATSDWPGMGAPKLAYNSSVHCGEGRLHAPREEEWQAVLVSPDARARFTGALIDLSLGGCTVRMGRAFGGDLYDLLEVSLEVRDQHFLFNGVVRAIYDPHTIGIQFSPTARHKREGLALLLVELCAATKTQLQAG